MISIRDDLDSSSPDSLGTECLINSNGVFVALTEFLFSGVIVALTESVLFSGAIVTINRLFRSLM